MFETIVAQLLAWSLRIKNQPEKLGNTETLVGGLFEQIVLLIKQLIATIVNISIGWLWKEAVNTKNDLATTYPNPSKGWAVLVRDENVIYSWDGVSWVNTGLTGFPSDVATKEDLTILNNAINVSSSRIDTLNKWRYNVKRSYPFELLDSRVLASDMEIGTIDSVSGLNSNSTTRIRSRFFEIAKHNIVNLTPIAEIKVFIFLYTQEKTYIKRLDYETIPANFQNIISTLIEEYNCKFIRFAFGFKNDRVVTVSDFNNMVSSVSFQFEEKPSLLIQRDFLASKFDNLLFELGSFSSVTGALTASTTRIRANQKISISKGGNVVINTKSTAVKVSVGKYSKSDNSFVSSAPFVEGISSLLYEDESLYYLPVFAYIDNREITNISNLTQYIEITYLDADTLNASSLPYSNRLITVAHMAGKLWGGYTGSVLIPEESISSMTLAHRCGFDYAEIDLRVTKDNKFVCMHDTTINRTMVNLDGTDITGTINLKDKTLAELEANYKYRSVNPLYQTKIFTFEEFLQACNEYHMIPYIHKGDLTKTLLTSFLNLVYKYNYKDFVFLVDDVEFAKIMRAYNPTTLIIYQDNSSVVSVNSVLNILRDIKSPCGFSTISLDNLTQSFCHSLRMEGFHVQASTSYEEGRIMEMLKNGVNMLLSNGWIPQFKGTIVNEIVAELNYNDINHTGTVTNSGLLLADGQKVTFPLTALYLGAIDMSAVMKGKINISIQYMVNGDVEISKNETFKFQRVTHNNTSMVITSIGDTLIRTINLKHYRL